MAGREGSGRKSKDTNTRQAQQTLTEAAVEAAKLIKRYISHRKGTTSGTRLKAAEIAISHALGTPRQKILLKTGVLTMQDLLELASISDENSENNDKTSQNAVKISAESGRKDNKGNGHKESESG